jgi:hypothetical protein
MNELIESKRDLLVYLRSQLEKGVPLLIVGLDNPKIYNLHNWLSDEIHKTVEHLGWGVFRGKTKHGRFTFCAGGAMGSYRFSDGWVSYTEVTVDNPKVLEDIGYDFKRMIQAINEEIDKL